MNTIAPQVPSHPNYLRQGWLVILLALLYGAALAGVQTGLSGRIEENKRAETFQVIPVLVRGADQARTVEHEVVLANGREATVYEAQDAGGATLGWVVSGSGQGFADRIEVLIGLDRALETITGLWVLDQKETPGLGDYITGAEFRDRFEGRPAHVALAAVKVESVAVHEIRVLSGATISSESVCEIVNRVVREMREVIGQQIIEAAAAG
jgi:Na+-translocating ferredoxin:NAD+ oxidoreductase subunit G